MTAPVKILMQPVNDQGGGQYRIIQPASIMRRNGYAIAQAHPHHVNSEALKVLDPDVVVVQIWQTDQQIETLKQYKKALPKAFFIYEIDDLFWAVPEGSYHRINPLLPKSRSQIRTAAKLCDAIVCATGPLAKEMKQLTGMRDVRVALNEVPKSFINAALAGRRSAEAIHSDKPRVGWAGGIGHGGDLSLLTEVVKELQDEVHWVFMGMAPPGVDPSTVEVHAGVPFTEYGFALGKLNLDLALAPLQDNEFNRCKSDLRVLEYGAAGFPVLASDIATYKTDPVTRCKNTPEDWIRCIRGHLSDRDALDRYAEGLHEWVVHHRCMDDHIGTRIASYLPNNVTPFVPLLHTTAQSQALVAVGELTDLLTTYATIEEARKAAPSADILYIRKGVHVSPNDIIALTQALGTNASASAITNDGIYPSFGKFTRLDPKVVSQVKAAAELTVSAPIAAPFPAGPCILLSSAALSRFGLPDTQRFGHVEFALAEWGARCCEGGKPHVTVPTVYTYADEGLQQVPQLAKQALDHISMWIPGFPTVIHSYQTSEPIAAIKEDLDLALNSLFYSAPPINNYTEWLSCHDTITERDFDFMREDLKTWKWLPHINVIMPVFNPPEAFLREAIDSVLAQAYLNYTLILVDDCSTEEHVRPILEECESDPRIKVVWRETNGHICNASNSGLEVAEDGWVVFVDHDDKIALHALYMIAREIVQNDDLPVEFIYSDSDKLTEAGDRVDPYYGPDFSYELLLAQNYVTHLCAYRLEEVQHLGGLQVGMEGSQDWDLTLRYLEATCGTPPCEKFIRHIPHVLYHWRQSPNSTAANIMAKPYAVEAGRRAVMQHLQRTTQAAFVAPNPALPLFNMVRFLVSDDPPKVTVIIPTKDNPDQLLRCISSLMGKTVYGNFNVIVVDNGSITTVGKSALVEVNKDKRISVIKQPGAFNFSLMNNKAVEKTDAEFVCFLNDDTEIIEPAWLNDLVGLAQRPGVGAVGTKLIYPDARVQHCGIIFSPKQPPGFSSLHMWQKLHMYSPGQAGRAVITQPVLAVTAACMVIRRSIFLEVNGFNGHTFPVDYNDVDLCIRLRKEGYRNIVSAQAVVRHYEGQTKKRERLWTLSDLYLAETALVNNHRQVRDPYINPNLEFHYSQSILALNPPAKPWNVEDRTRVLIINGRDEDAREAFREGNLPFCASLEGHYLMFTIPTMQHVRGIDLRGDTGAVLTVLAKLNIHEIVFCGIGDGTLASLGFFAALARNGFPVFYSPKAHSETQNDRNYYTPAGWASSWQDFFNAIAPVEADTAAD